MFEKCKFHNEEGIYFITPTIVNWGRRRNPQNWSFSNVPTTFLFDRGYTGHEHMDKFDLINMNGRVYDPRLGRMLSPDPFVSTPTYSQSYNRYTYAYNNPLKYTDPTGYFAPNINRGTGGWNGMISGVSRLFNLGRPTFTQGNYGDNYFYRGDGLYTLGPNIVNYAEVHNNYVVPNADVPEGSSGDGSNGLLYTQTSDGWSIAGYYSSEGDKYYSMFNNITIVPVGNGNTTTQDLRTWSSIGSAGEGTDWFTPTGHINNGFGGFGAGMTQFGGTFRLSNSRGFSPKFYGVSSITGRGWGGGGRGLIKTYNAAGWGKGIGYGSIGVSMVLGGIYVTSAWQQDGNQYGINTHMAVAQTTYGIAGAWMGAEIGAGIGLWFGGVGAIPGAVIGGAIGGVIGGYGGSKFGKFVVNY